MLMVMATQKIIVLLQEIFKIVIYENFRHTTMKKSMMNPRIFASNVFVHDFLVPGGFFKWTFRSNGEIICLHGNFTFQTVFSYVRLSFTHNLPSGTGRNTLVLCDTGTELLFCLANVKSLTAFASVFINDIRCSQLRNLILVWEAITNSVRALEKYP